jgi:hypothetical protein
MIRIQDPRSGKKIIPDPGSRSWISDFGSATQVKIISTQEKLRRDSTKNKEGIGFFSIKHNKVFKIIFHYIIKGQMK